MSGRIGLREDSQEGRRLAWRIARLFPPRPPPRQQATVSRGG
ncbi:hypothetical protein [Pseudomonas mangiferae]|nr:hypothetical protein [Pseudomonas mangiferae]